MVWLTWVTHYYIYRTRAQTLPNDRGSQRTLKTWKLLFTHAESPYLLTLPPAPHRLVRGMDDSNENWGSWGRRHHSSAFWIFHVRNSQQSRNIALKLLSFRTSLNAKIHGETGLSTLNVLVPVFSIHFKEPLHNALSRYNSKTENEVHILYNSYYIPWKHLSNHLKSFLRLHRVYWKRDNINTN